MENEKRKAMTKARSVELMLEGRPAVMRLVLSIEDAAKREEAVLLILREAMNDLVALIDLE